jgi:hypothetical protein
MNKITFRDFCLFYINYVQIKEEKKLPNDCFKIFRLMKDIFCNSNFLSFTTDGTISTNNAFIVLIIMKAILDYNSEMLKNLFYSFNLDLKCFNGNGDENYEIFNSIMFEKELNNFLFESNDFMIDFIDEKNVSFNPCIVDLEYFNIVIKSSNFPVLNEFI